MLTVIHPYPIALEERMLHRFSITEPTLFTISSSISLKKVLIQILYIQRNFTNQLTSKKNLLQRQDMIQKYIVAQLLLM
jgi:hypothetical protein